MCRSCRLSARVVEELPYWCGLRNEGPRLGLARVRPIRSLDIGHGRGDWTFIAAQRPPPLLPPSESASFGLIDRMLAPPSPPLVPATLSYPDDQDIERTLSDRRQTVSQRSKEDDIHEEDEDQDDKVPDGYDPTRDGKYAPEKQAEKWDGQWGIVGKAMGWLIRNGVEARGIQPVRAEDRAVLTKWSYLPQATLWAAANTNILTFS